MENGKEIRDVETGRYNSLMITNRRFDPVRASPEMKTSPKQLD
jgi:hypothetical protein